MTYDDLPLFTKPTFDGDTFDPFLDQLAAIVASRSEAVPGGCVVWTGGLQSKGYGAFRFRRRLRYAHRVAYVASRGPIPRGLVVDHLCRNRACVNPAHMELVTSVENVMRGVSIPAVNARKDTCVRGHSDWSVRSSGPFAGRRRWCRACSREDCRARRHALASSARRSA